MLLELKANVVPETDFESCFSTNRISIKINTSKITTVSKKVIFEKKNCTHKIILRINNFLETKVKITKILKK